jgi:hypothetical protein
MSIDDCSPNEPDGRERAKLFQQVRERARELLTDKNRLTSKLYADDRIWQPGEVITLPFQKIKVKQPSVLVFADDKPWAGYGHDCRYAFYDVRTAKLIKEVPALFPPYLNRSSRTLKLFYDMTPRVLPPAPMPSVMEALSGSAPAPIPTGKRYALLFQGGNESTHMNDLEFSYRTLVQHYLFDPADITVLSGDGTLKDSEGKIPQWPGNGTPGFTMTINYPGTRPCLLAELDRLAQKVAEDDLVFIHLSGHGSPNGATSEDAAPDSASLVCFNLSAPELTDHLDSDELEDKIGKFGKHRDLLVLMAQCYAGGFIPGIRRATQATRTHIAAAARFDKESANTADFRWPVFSRAWISAQLGQDPAGSLLNPDADTSDDGSVQASEAYKYARVHKDPHDKPVQGKKGTGATKITLGAGLPVAYSWHTAVGPPVQVFLEANGGTKRAYHALRTAMPDLQKLVAPAIEANTAVLRSELTPRIEAILAAALDAADGKAVRRRRSAGRTRSLRRLDPQRAEASKRR